MKAFTSSQNKKYLKRAVSICLWLVIWQIAFTVIDNELLIASPLQVGLRLSELVRTGEFWLITGKSLLKITEGYLLGVAFGTVLAVLTAKSEFLYEFFYPVISVVRATPVASFIILALVWLKRENISLFICLLMVLPIVWANVTQGIRDVDGKLIEMGRVYGFGAKKLLTKIYIPSVMPYFTTGVTTSLGLAWKAGIAAEVLSTPKNYIGTQLYDSKIYIETVDLFAWTAVVILLSFLLEKAVVWLIRKFLKGDRAYD